MGLFGKAPAPPVEDVLEAGERVVGTVGATGFLDADRDMFYKYDDVVVTTLGLRVRWDKRWNMYAFSEMVDLRGGAQAIGFRFKQHLFLVTNKADALADLHVAQAM
jgi:hypothetical protein